MKTKKSAVLAGVMALMCMLCERQAFAQTADNRSYYVRADGNDETNDGRSEKAPFKTLQRAVELAADGVVRTVTVIGSVSVGEGEYIDENIWYASIKNAGTREILITGKPNAKDAEKALISGGISIANSKVRLTHVRITNKSGFGLLTGYKSVVTLGAGALIYGCGKGGVVMVDVTLNMTENATISGNTTANIGGGVFCMGENSTLNMHDNAIISNNNAELGGGVAVSSGNINIFGRALIYGNTASRFGGGVSMADGSTLNMSGNATISGNTTANIGGGVVMANGSTLNMSGNAVISGNNAGEFGGGIAMTDSIVKGGKVTENTAELGGGIASNGSECKMENIEVSRNKAGYGAGIYIGSGKLTVTGGKITNNEARYAGGGVYEMKGAMYTANGVSVTGNRVWQQTEDVFRQ
jgi:predicted outer membrane repeat protein